MNKILFPTDFSDCAKHAQRVAVSLAKTFDAELEVIHIVSDTIFKWESETHMRDTINMLPTSGNVHVVDAHTGLESLQVAMKELRDELLLQGVNVKTHLLFGESHTEILKFAKQEEPALIVMGTNGASGLKEEFVGSKTQWVNRYANSAVLSVRNADDDNFKIDNIVYASDFREKGANNNLEQINIFAKFFDAKIHLLYINTPHHFEESMACYDRIEEIAEKHAMSNYDIHIYNHFTVEDGVLSFAEKFGPDVVAISNHGNSGIKRWTEFRTTEVLINHAKVPVLSLNID